MLFRSYVGAYFRSYAPTYLYFGLHVGASAGADALRRVTTRTRSVAALSFLVLRRHARTLRSIDGPEKRRYAVAKARIFWLKLRHKLHPAGGTSSAVRDVGDVPAENDEELVRWQRWARWVLVDVRGYIPPTFRGRITCFVAGEETAPTLGDIRLLWQRRATEGAITRYVPGDHLSMIAEPAVHVLAEELKAWLARAQATRAAAGAPSTNGAKAHSP